jgi:hypothetical protein
MKPTPTVSPLEASLLVVLTNSATPPRPFRLSKTCAVVVLSRTIRSLNLTKAENLDELYTRRETAAVLANLRMEIQRETMRERP